jgi:integrase
MSTIQITKRSIDQLPHPENGQTWHFDRDLKGFGVCVGRKTKTYFAQRDIHGRTVRVTIGRHDPFTPEVARKKARELLAQMASGQNPNHTKREARAKGITLAEAYKDYLEARKELRPSTLRDYDRVINTYLADWRRIPLAEITKDMVSQRHRYLGDTKGAFTANSTMRVLRAIYNFARATHEHLPENPVSRLSQTRAWYREERRRGVIRPHELASWYRAVMSLKNSLARDYLRLLLFTGLRRSEAASLEWDDVDLVGRTLTIRETKNREPLVLPLSDFLWDMLAARHEASPNSQWVFPGPGKSGHLSEPKTAVRQVVTLSGIDFTPHDLRRTFLTIAESLDVPAYALKQLANHKTKGDVTAGYIVSDAERLRPPMELITNHLLQKAMVVDRSSEVGPTNG